MADREDPFVAARDRFLAAAPVRADEPAWLQARRTAARVAFAEQGLPTRRNEDWKYTRLDTLAAQPYAGADALPDAMPTVPAAVEALAGARLVFVDGHFAPTLSRRVGLPEGCDASSLREALLDGAGSSVGGLAEHLGAHASVDGRPLTALNAASFVDGAFVHVAEGAVVDAPIHLVHLATSRPMPVAVHPRHVVVVGRGASVTVVEHFHGEPGARYLTNSVTEILCGPNSTVRHHKLQRESVEAHHITALSVRAARDATFTDHAFAFGSAMTRTGIDVKMEGAGVDCTLRGLYLGRGRQHLDHQILIDHAQPHCTSRQLYKGILDDRARGVFTGRVLVAPGAVKTSAEQSNPNLLLTPDAHAKTRPQLEIYTDDVQCSHGATVGQVDDEAMFYLRSRGLSIEQAQDLMTYAFANEVIESVGNADERAALDAALLDWLPGHTMSEGMA